MRYSVPHPIPYQGSKRHLAPAILSFIPRGRFTRLIEPFAGSAAIALAVASQHLCERYVISEFLPPLAELWREIIARPEALSKRYRALWKSQGENPRERFNEIRAAFNVDHEPAKLLYLLARCVKNAVRFNATGKFNQSPDNRRLGVRPDTEEREIWGAHRVLSGHCEVLCADFRETLRHATSNDLVYLDPPYEGISNGRDRRYIRGVKREELVEALDDLNRRSVQFLLSYDGTCGDKSYGEALPSFLCAHRVHLDAGRSSQATLAGRNLKTIESLYVSAGLGEGRSVPSAFHWKEPASGALHAARILCVFCNPVVSTGASRMTFRDRRVGSFSCPNANSHSALPETRPR
jgi:DNA adenine methylase